METDTVKVDPPVAEAGSDGIDQTLTVEKGKDEPPVPEKENANWIERVKSEMIMAELVDGNENKEQTVEPVRLRGAQKRKRKSLYSRPFVINADVDEERKILPVGKKKVVAVEQTSQGSSKQKQIASKIVVKQAEERKKVKVSTKGGGVGGAVKLKGRRTKARARATINALCKQILKKDRLVAKVDDGKDKDMKKLQSPVKIKDKLEDKKEQKSASSVESKFVLENIDDKMCKICGKEFNLRSSALRHVRVNHYVDESAEYKCEICATVYINKRQLVAHNYSQHRQPLLCDTCGKHFKQRAHLKTHILSMHSNVTIKCLVEGCDKVFKNDSNRRRHVNSVHLNIRRYQCESCSLKFKTRGALNVHTYTQHTEAEKKKKFPCAVCGKVFYSRPKLQYHESVHQETKGFPCTFEGCNKSFRLNSNRVKHERVHTNYKPYMCDECGEKFSRKVYLETHQYKHTGIKKFQCDICYKFFSQRGNLTVHMRLHSGDSLSYQCDICHKIYHHKSNFTKHLKSHQQEAEAEDRKKPHRVKRDSVLKYKLVLDDSDFTLTSGKDGAGLPVKMVEKSTETSDITESVANTVNDEKVEEALPESVKTIVKGSNNIPTFVSEQDAEGTSSLKVTQSTSVASAQNEYTEIITNEIEDDAQLKDDFATKLFETIKREGINSGSGVQLTFISSNGETNDISIHGDVLKEFLEKFDKQSVNSSTVSSIVEAAVTASVQELGTVSSENTVEPDQTGATSAAVVDTSANANKEVLNLVVNETAVQGSSEEDMEETAVQDSVQHYDLMENVQEVVILTEDAGNIPEVVISET